MCQISNASHTVFNSLAPRLSKVNSEFYDMNPSSTIFFRYLIFLVLVLINYFPPLSISQDIDSSFEDNNSGSSSSGENVEALQKLFAVNLHLSSIPGDEVIVFGKQRNLSDPFGGILPVVHFLGIPYARSPVEELRFQRPSRHTPAFNFRAIREPSPCPQIGLNGAKMGNEDCLYLNVYMLKKLSNDTMKMPVLVWFHGESLDYTADKKFNLFSTGSAQDLNPDIFLLNNIIVVTPQYRLGSLGYLSTSNEDLNGNMGLFDKLSAIEWVQKYIDDFGGDSQQITVMGHGSAAVEVGLLTTSDLARGLFQRGILMGGSPLSPFAIDTKPKSTFAEIALQNSCPSFPTLRFVRCMQQKSVENILRADETLSKGKHLGKMKMPLPVIQKDADGRFLPPILSSSPTSTLGTGKFEQIPVIIGVSAAEMNGFLPSVSGRESAEIASNIFINMNVLKQFIRAILARNTNDADLLSELIAFEYFAGLNITDEARHEQARDIVEEMIADYIYHIPALTFAKLWSKFAPVYFYVFDYVSNKANQQGGEDTAVNRAGSGGKQIISEEEVDIIQLPTIQAHHGSDLRFLMEGYEGSAEDRDIANVMVDLWINFIHKGSPQHAGMEWPQFREGSKSYLSITKNPGIQVGFHDRQEQLWTSVFDEVKSQVCKLPSGLSASRRRNYKELDTYLFYEKPTQSFPNTQYY